MKKKIILLTLIISFGIVTYFTYALYKSHSSGSTTIGTATFSVSMAGNENDASLIEDNSTFTKTVTVTNNSEVDVTYSIIISNLPTGMQVSLDNGSYVTETSNQITFTNVGTVLYGGSPVNHSLKFNAPLNVSEVSNQAIDINVEFEQVLN